VRRAILSVARRRRRSGNCAPSWRKTRQQPSSRSISRADRLGAGWPVGFLRLALLFESGLQPAGADRDRSADLSASASRNRELFPAIRNAGRTTPGQFAHRFPEEALATRSAFLAGVWN